jgi:Domain of unknown function (DUF4190)
MQTPKSLFLNKMAVVSPVVAVVTWILAAVLILIPNVAGSLEEFLFIPITLFAGSVAGAVAGHYALGQIKQNGEEGKGIAWIGLVFGYLNLAALAIMIAYWVGLFIFLVIMDMTHTRKPT